MIWRGASCRRRGCAGHRGSPSRPRRPPSWCRTDGNRGSCRNRARDRPLASSSVAVPRRDAWARDPARGACHADRAESLEPPRSGTPCNRPVKDDRTRLSPRGHGTHDSSRRRARGCSPPNLGRPWHPGPSYWRGHSGPLPVAPALGSPRLPRTWPDCALALCQRSP